jgi:hypothetical protein
MKTKKLQNKVTALQCFDVTSYSSVDRAAWLGKVTSQRAVPYRKQDGGVNRGHGNRIKNNMAARI